MWVFEAGNATTASAGHATINPLGFSTLGTGPSSTLGALSSFLLLEVITVTLSAVTGASNGGFALVSSFSA